MSSTPKGVDDRGPGTRRIQTLRAIRVLAVETVAQSRRLRGFQLLLILSMLPVFAAVRTTRPVTPLEESLVNDARMLVEANVAPSMVEALRSVTVSPPENVDVQVPWPERVDDGLCVRIDFRNEANADALMRSWRRLSGLLGADLETDGRPEIEVLAEAAIRSDYDACVALQDPWETTVLHLAVRSDSDGLPSGAILGGPLRRRIEIPDGVRSERDLALFAFTSILDRRAFTVFLLVALLISVPIVLSSLRREAVSSLMEAGARPRQILLGRLTGLLWLVGLPLCIGVSGTAVLLGDGIDPAPGEVLWLIPQALLAFASVLAVTVAGMSLGLPVFWILATTFGAWFFAENLAVVTDVVERSSRRPGEGLETAMEVGREILPRTRELAGAPTREDVIVTLRTLIVLYVLAELSFGRGRSVRPFWRRASPSSG